MFDSMKQPFWVFRVDAKDAFRKKADWREGVLEGCFYPATHAVFIQRNGSYVPGALLLGKRLLPAERVAPAGACQLAETAETVAAQP
jgi:hypothetical protein